MAKDILNQIRVSSINHKLEMNEEIRNRTLLLIEDVVMCNLMGSSLSVRFGMSNPKTNDAFNRKLEWVRKYDHQALNLVVQMNVPYVKKLYDA